jgi:centromeric protein E
LLPFACTEDLDEYCKEVRCVELEESSRDNSDPSLSENGDSALTVSGEENGTSQEISSHLNEDSHDGQSLRAMSANMSNYRNLKLTRSWSCSEYRMAGSPETGEIERTPANGFEKGFPGRPDGLWKKFNPLNFDGSTRFARNDSQSSVGSQSVDDLRGNSMRTSGDEDITSIHTFVAGMKEMVKLEYEKQLVDGQVRINNFFCSIDSRS